MKIHGYNEPLREIALILKEITGLWYDMCTVKLGYKYTDPDSRLKKRKNLKKKTNEHSDVTYDIDGTVQKNNHQQSHTDNFLINVGTQRE